MAGSSAADSFAAVRSEMAASAAICAAVASRLPAVPAGDYAAAAAAAAGVVVAACKPVGDWAAVAAAVGQPVARCTVAALTAAAAWAAAAAAATAAALARRVAADTSEQTTCGVNTICSISRGKQQSPGAPESVDSGAVA